MAIATTVKSMTGFGRAEVLEAGLRYLVEVRSYNHRFLDISLRMGREDLVFEDKIKGLIASRVTRGRVEVHLQKEPPAEAPLGLRISYPVAEEIVGLLDQLRDKFSLAPQLSLESLLNFKDVLFTREKKSEEPADWSVLERAISNALDSLDGMRAKEGAAIAEDFVARLDRMELTIRQIREHAGQNMETIKARLHARLKDLAAEFSWDESRLLQEAAFLAMKSDINEELERIVSHFSQFKESLAKGGAIGRRLEFILQEINREINTLGAKMGDFPVSLGVVELKAELEKLKEQSQNLE